MAIYLDHVGRFGILAVTLVTGLRGPFRPNPKI